SDEDLAFIGDDVLDHLLEMRDLLFVARHEDVTHAVLADLRQGDALLGHFLTEEAVRDLHENARAITHKGVGADGTAVRQVLENEETVLDDLVRLLTLHMGDKADAAGIVLVAW